MPAAGVRSVILRAGNGLKIELVERDGSAAQEFTDPFDGANTQGYFHWAVYVDDLDGAFQSVLAAGAREERARRVDAGSVSCRQPSMKVGFHGRRRCPRFPGGPL